MIGIDIETFDPLIRDKGPGVYRRDGRILGVSIYRDGRAQYLGIAHKDTSSETRNKSLKMIREIIEDDKTPLIGANIIYDLDWLCNFFGFELSKRELHDVQLAEPLIDEYRYSYSLDSLAEKYLNTKKEKTEIDDFCFYNNLKGDARAHLHLMPELIVKKYAEIDAILPVKIFEKQLAIIKDEGLEDVYNLERGLLPMLLKMRKTGVLVDRDQINKKIEYLETEIEKEQKQINKKYGNVNVKSNLHMKEVFDELGLEYPMSEKGNPTFDKEFLKTVSHEFAQSVLKIRELRTIKDTFFINSFSEMNVNGRIHASFNPLRSDEFGTVSGRFSSSNPNLQQIPSKGETMGEFCREIFKPDNGCHWGKIDYSQIEYRLIANYATGERADLVRKKYNDDPGTDYHQFVMDLTGLDRKSAKIMNFGLAYFMGAKSLSKKYGWTVEKAQSLIDIYFKEVPFLKTTRQAVVDKAIKSGFIKTILGRRARMTADIKKAGKEHSFFNRLIQGSSADLMKKAMFDSWNAGVWGILKPHITVHDELDFSIPDDKTGVEAVKELIGIMENCIKLKIPLKAEFEMGDDWAHVSKEKAEGFLNERI